MKAETHRFNPTILREYDIRGTIGKDLSEADARAIGRAFGTMVARRGGKTVATGRDGRTSSPGLETALAEGLAASGLTVLRTGLGPTPMLYYAVNALDADGGVMVTGSHNPPDMNGFKIMIGKEAFYGAQIQELGKLAASGDYVSGKGRLENKPVLDAYIDRVVADYRGGRELKIAWDAGNGSAGEAMVKLTKKLPGKHILLYEKIDGTFPNHHPDPTQPETLEDLQKVVRKEGCDLGIAFDGDGDRVGAVDGQGRVIFADLLMVLFAGDVLADKPGSTIIADVKASQVLFDEIARMGGKPLMWQTGHSLIKTKMKEIKAPLAGEMSGHIFFADRYYGYDDALYAAMRLASIVARATESLGTLRDKLPSVVNTPELRFPCDEARKFTVINEVKQRLKASGADVNDIDGVRVRTGDGWWLLRASNTQAVLVARCEAKDEAGLERLKTLLRDQVKASGIEPPAF
ncbi:MAG: phosphoglucomutase/phosphomannomutase PgmG [Candidatus Eiseniibacteriota bacterium]